MLNVVFTGLANFGDQQTHHMATDSATGDSTEPGAVIDNFIIQIQPPLPHSPLLTPMYLCEYTYVL